MTRLQTFVFATIALSVAIISGCHRSSVESGQAHGAAMPSAPATIDDTFTEASVGLDLDLLEDPASTFTVEDVVAAPLATSFERSQKASPNFGYTKSTWWARLTLDDRRDATKHRSGDALALTLAYAQTDDARTWCFDDRGRRLIEQRAGDHVARAQWPNTFREPTFDVPPGARTCLLRIQGGGATVQFPVTLRSREAFTDHRITDTAFQGLYFGALVVMIAYNGLVAIATRSLAYGFYTLFLLSYGLFQCAFGGFGFAVLWPDRFGWTDRAAPFFIASLGASSVAFAASLLYLPQTAPRMWKLARLALVFFFAHMTCMWALPYSLAIRVVLGIAPVWVFVLLGSGILQSWRGVRVAKLYVAAWSVFIIGTFFNVIRLVGVVPTNAFTVNAQQLGSAIEFVLLSFALSDRIKTLQAEVATQANLARDASQRALTEQERTNAELTRLNALKDEFLANTSHELRTPLHGILGLSEAVLGTPGLDATSRERLNLVVASGRRLASLVNDILDFSKLRHQGIAIREKPVHLAEAVKLALTVLDPMASSKGLSLRSSIPDGVIVRADENRLQQILTNLIGTAVKFTESGDVVVAAERRDDRIFVSVRDSGIGIPKDAQSRIFESFEQADGSTSREYGGTGLGLAVTKKLVELHGGRIAVDSEPGRGSTFTFDLAQADTREELAPNERNAPHASSMVLRAAASHLVAPNPTRGPAELDAREAPSNGSSGHLLIADDDPVNVEVLRAQLEPEGYRVTTARDGREALAALETHGTFDGVLLDVMMPKMTGPEAAKKMRADHPHGTLPILMLTAKSRPEDVVLGLRSGASDYVGKPFHREELLQRLDAHMQAVRTGRAFRRFVPGDVLELLGVTRFEALEAGIGQKNNLTVLFTDIRDFTKRSEALGPEGTFRFVNGCLARFEPVVRANGGFVDKFIGDAVMAIFPGDPLDAVRAAEGLAAQVRSFNESRPNDPMPLAIGIGVHKGPVILGTVGAAERMEVTVIGDAVNVASRLENLTKGIGAGALVSQDALGGEHQGTRRVGAVRVKGRREPVELFEILACCASEDERTQKQSADDRFQRGLRAFAQGDMSRAREHFHAAVSVAPLDRLAAMYLERCDHFLEAGVPEDFDGSLVGSG